MKKICDTCIKCKEIYRSKGRVLCREWTHKNGIAEEGFLERNIPMDCKRWKEKNR